MGILYNKKLLTTRNTKTEEVFEGLFGDVTFEQLPYSSPLNYISQYWTEFEKVSNATNSLIGNMWECVINSLLYREGLLPFYRQAKVAFVPNVNFDIILYTRSFPINISLKTSLRERYKQADLEAIALKYVHRRAKSFLLTLESEEAKSCKEKIKTGEIIGLDGIVDCNTCEVNDLFCELHKIKDEFTESNQVDVVTGILIK